MKFAFGLAADAQQAGPGGFLPAVRLDVVAQAPAETPRERILATLQELLAERMKLVSHRELREMSYLALAEAKGGNRLQPANPAAGSVNAPSIAGRIDSQRMPIDTLARLLSRFEQLGLPLEARKGPVEVLVVDSTSRVPVEN